MVPVERQVDALPTWGQAFPLILFTDGTPPLSSDSWMAVGRRNGREPARRCLQSAPCGPGELLRHALQNFRHLGPLRGTPPRNYAPPRFRDLSRWADGAAAWALLHGDAALARSTSRWLSGEDGLAAGYTVRLKEYKELALNRPLMVLLRSAAGVRRLGRCPAHARPVADPVCAYACRGQHGHRGAAARRGGRHLAARPSRRTSGVASRRPGRRGAAGTSRPPQNPGAAGRLIHSQATTPAGGSCWRRTANTSSSDSCAASARHQRTTCLPGIPA